MANTSKVQYKSLNNKKDNFRSNFKKIMEEKTKIENIFKEIEEKNKKNCEIKSKIKRLLRGDLREFNNDVGNTATNSTESTTTPVKAATNVAQTPGRMSYSTIYWNQKNKVRRTHRAANYTKANAISGATEATITYKTKTSTRPKTSINYSTSMNGNKSTSSIIYSKATTQINSKTGKDQEPTRISFSYLHRNRPNHTVAPTTSTIRATRPTSTNNTKTSTDGIKPTSKTTNISHSSHSISQKAGKAQEPIRKSFSFMHRNRTNELKKTLSTTNHTNAPTTSTKAIGGAAKPTNTTKTLKTHANEPASSKSSNISHKTSQVTEKSEKPTRMSYSYMFRHGTTKVPTISTKAIIGATKPTNTEQIKISTNTYNSTSTNTNRPTTTNISQKTSIDTNNTTSTNIYRTPGENSKQTKVDVKDSSEKGEIERAKRRLTFELKNPRPDANVHTSPTEKTSSETNTTTQNLNDGLPNSNNTEDQMPSRTARASTNKNSTSTFSETNTTPIKSAYTNSTTTIIEQFQSSSTSPSSSFTLTPRILTKKGKNSEIIMDGLQNFSSINYLILSTAIKKRRLTQKKKKSVPLLRKLQLQATLKVLHRVSKLGPTNLFYAARENLFAKKRSLARHYDQKRSHKS
ncbi:hypothetical protein HELRODRAFT_171165 [Helobdella robusta]|uniref:Uncharacterized protein n=1 Tax=Helobdella robusta TaxID=6412 RepID=T1F3W1_HELRO|nr:hypothetical protein HELRODRAFT_171165 [Helobdella robusta]ESO05527.1 hypothetical protein HELRODRAFT_171165 [Helobdella robusta]